MMINPGDILTLRGKTLKGKNRIREHGSQWRVIKIADGSNKWVPKGEIFLESVAVDPFDNPDNRWIDPLRDQHFEIIPANE
jgi:hypothetical protein